MVINVGRYKNTLQWFKKQAKAWRLGSLKLNSTKQESCQGEFH